MAWIDVRTAAAGKQIWVTERPEMLRIMRHEFHDETGNNFDPKPLYEYLRTLEPQQVRLLFSYPHEKYLGKHRLVIFITLDPSINLPMCADTCDTAATLINSNSHFAVFHCDGETQFISLVCYTKEFNLFLHRPPLDVRTAESPKVYKISAMNMSDVPSGEGDTIWNRVSTVGSNDVGTAIYGGESVLNPETGKMEGRAPNSLHGMINTMGCWMLFRNYNWNLHTHSQAEFLNAYRDLRRHRDISAKLAQFYPNEAQSNRMARFLHWERDYAYTWFTRDIIGIDYFSANPCVNETNIIDSSQIDNYPAVPKKEEIAIMPSNCHSWGARHGRDRTFKMTKSLWEKGNALGFKPAEDFAPFTGKETHGLESKSWADVYIYTT